jgi:hypothetical protein
MALPGMVMPPGLFAGISAPAFLTLTLGTSGVYSDAEYEYGYRPSYYGSLTPTVAATGDTIFEIYTKWDDDEGYVGFTMVLNGSVAAGTKKLRDNGVNSTALSAMIRSEAGGKTYFGITLPPSWLQWTTTGTKLIQITAS